MSGGKERRTGGGFFAGPEFSLESILADAYEYVTIESCLILFGGEPRSVICMFEDAVQGWLSMFHGVLPNGGGKSTGLVLGEGGSRPSNAISAIFLPGTKRTRLERERKWEEFRKKERIHPEGGGLLRLSRAFSTVRFEMGTVRMGAEGRW
jgi:hypothetical protein